MGLTAAHNAECEADRRTDGRPEPVLIVCVSRLPHALREVAIELREQAGNCESHSGNLTVGRQTL